MPPVHHSPRSWQTVRNSVRFREHRAGGSGLAGFVISIENGLDAIKVVVLVGLFLAQRHGTGLIGSIFGPIMLAWFMVIGALGKRPFLFSGRSRECAYRATRAMIGGGWPREECPSGRGSSG